MQERGIALPVALILLAVIGLSSITIMRSSTFGAMIAGNLRQGQLAMQAAEAALRFCERQVMSGAPAVPVQPIPAVASDTPTAWNNVANWAAGAGMVVTLPNNVVDSAAAGIRYARAPECMVERMELLAVRGAMDEEAFQITARGFSPNFRSDANGAINGAEVWLQSTIRYTP
ncbi:MAG: PilX N-terminal domain-containing pilus assembly protein [Burkholderiaceae bacterium]